MENKRIATLKSRLGEATNYIDDEKFLPLFRNRQINHKKEFEQAIKLAKSGKIRKPSHWFAKIWAVENLSKTLKMLRAYINQNIAKLAQKRELRRQNERREDVFASFNEAGRNKYRQMMIERGLISG